MGDVRDFSNFLGAVIDERHFVNTRNTNKVSTANVLFGGGSSDKVGWFIEHIGGSSISRSRLMQEEILVQLFALYFYDDAQWSSILEKVDQTSHTL